MVFHINYYIEFNKLIRTIVELDVILQIFNRFADNYKPYRVTKSNTFLNKRSILDICPSFKTWSAA